MNEELIVINNITIPEIPKEWDYEIENKNFDELIFGWRRLTIDVVSILWVFYKKLKTNKWRSNINSENSELIPTWLEWCKSKGLDSDTALSHFRKYGWLSSKILVNKFTGDNEWATPSEFIESSRIVMGSIDLDPASNTYAQQTVKAKEYYSNDNDGLDKKWYGNIFLNPPYATGEIDKFINKLYEEINNINQFILLTNNNTDTQWFSTSVWLSDLVCFTKGRIHFHKSDEISSPTNGQTFFYKGANEKGFINEFDKYGIIMKVVSG